MGTMAEQEALMIKKSDLMGVLAALVLLVCVPVLANMVVAEAQGTATEFSPPMPKIEVMLVRDDSMTPVFIDPQMTAVGMIGQHISHGEDNKRIATIKDIIIDKEGHGHSIVVADGDFPGIKGKLASFDYEAVINLTPQGDIVMPVTDKSIESISEFSYDPADAQKTDVKGVPEGGFSMAQFLKGHFFDSAGKKIAPIQNISFKNGHAAMVMADRQALQVKGNPYAFEFDSARVVRSVSDIGLTLTEAQMRHIGNAK